MTLSPRLQFPCVPMEVPARVLVLQVVRVELKPIPVLGGHISGSDNFVVLHDTD